MFRTMYPLHSVDVSRIGEPEVIVTCNATQAKVMHKTGLMADTLIDTIEMLELLQGPEGVDTYLSNVARQLAYYGL